MNIVALDPGGTTGVAYCNLFVEGQTFYTAQLYGDHHDSLYELLTLNKNIDTVICERFEYRNHSKAGLSLISKEYIGVVNLAAQTHGLHVVYQNASQAKGFVKNRHLKALDLYERSEPHAMDALRHLLFWLLATPGNLDDDTRASLLVKGWKSG